MAETQYVGVQFNDIGKIFTFSADPELNLKPGMTVLVNTVRGRQLGKVVTVDLPQQDYNVEMQPVERIATDEDLAYKESLAGREAEALKTVRAYLLSSTYEGVKAINAEYAFDGNRLTFYLNYDNESGFDIKQFLREISRQFENTRIDVRQVGPRDMAKTMSGLGACGIEKRCCSRFLKEFSSISIKMAKSQDISLTPAEITGICGRLRCCLIYEYDTYEEARKLLPKRKKLVTTPLGEGKVVQVLPLSSSVIVDLPEGGPRKFTLQELESGVLAEKVVEAPRFNEQFVPESEDVEIVQIENRDQPVRTERSRRSGRRGRTARTDKQTTAQSSGTAEPRKSGTSQRKRRADRLVQRTQDQVGTRFSAQEQKEGSSSQSNPERNRTRSGQRSRSPRNTDQNQKPQEARSTSNERTSRRRSVSRSRQNRTRRANDETKSTTSN